jgi:TPR repeat protein
VAYETGVPGVLAPDPAKSFQWFLRAAAAPNNSPEAQFQVGRMYARGSSAAKVVASRTEAGRYLRRAVDQEHVEAMVFLGTCLLEGFGGTYATNAAEAVKLFELAAEKGSLEAENHIGQCYLEGSGVTENAAKAVKCFQRAAEKGNASAQFSLGSCVELGRGTRKVREKAVEWYAQAAKQGHVGATRKLAEFARAAKRA